LLGITTTSEAGYEIERTPGQVEYPGTAAERAERFLEANARIETTIEVILATRIVEDVEMERSDDIQLPDYNYAFGDMGTSGTTFEDALKASWSRVARDHPSEANATMVTTVEASLAAQIMVSVETEPSDMTQLPEYTYAFGDTARSETLFEDVLEAGCRRNALDYPSQDYYDVENSDEESREDDSTQCDDTEPVQLKIDIKNAYIPEDIFENTEDAGPSGSVDASFSISGAQSDVASESRQAAHDFQDDGSNLSAEMRHQSPSVTIENDCESASDSKNSLYNLHVVDPNQGDTKPPEPTYDNFSTVSESEDTPQNTPDTDGSQPPSTTKVENPPGTYHGALNSWLPLELLSNDPLPLTLRRYSEGYVESKRLQNFTREIQVRQERKGYKYPTQYSLHEYGARRSSEVPDEPEHRGWRSKREMRDAYAIIG
jgi:hypothetical protein